jgi:hypothetical protein
MREWGEKKGKKTSEKEWGIVFKINKNRYKSG